MDARARLRELSDFAAPWAVWIAATLRLADHIRNGADTPAALATASGADEDALARLMAYLVARGVFAATDDAYANTEVSELLIGDDSFRTWLDLDGAPRVWAASWTHLLPAVRTGSPGRSEGWYYDELERTDTAASFDALMANQSARAGQLAAEAYDWSSIGSVADIGGGTGRLLRAILDAHPHLHGTLFDQPQVVATVEAGPRLDVIPGDLFTDPLPGADVLVLSQILHGWPDEAAARILARCAGAAERVLVVESVLPSRPSADEASFDLFMLTLVGGRQRTLADFGRLGAACGLVRCTETPLANGNSLVELAH
jgi:2,7-dihydroxy-5-methyl-1-naphthoate 7-O-methyltransferase